MTRILTVIALLTFIAPMPAAAQEFTEDQKAQMNELFKDYLLENGELVLESVNKYQADLAAKEQEEASKKAAEFLKTLETRDDLARAGNPEGDITIVEFFDYNCGYCTRALDALQTVLKDEDNINVIFMDMPILGPSSMEASKWSLAAQNQGKYWEYHQAIMEHKGQKDAAALEKIAKDLNLDVDQLKEDKESSEIADRLQKNIQEAETMNIRGTPGFIIEGDITPGYIPAAEIKRIIAEKRNSRS
ncbi:MAG: DsbA family protein [Pseudomonadota bacterium]